MTPDAGAARRLEGQPGRALPACVGEYYFPTARAEFYSSSANPTAASATPGATPACVSFATTVALETMSIRVGIEAEPHRRFELRAQFVLDHAGEGQDRV